MAHLQRGMSRRRFLQRAGTLGAAVGVPGLLAACGGGEGGEGDPAAGGTEPAAGGTGSPAAGGETLRIGLMVPLSGTYASLGEDMRDGFQFYLDEHDGQLGGRPVELVVVETEANPEVGLRAAQRLINEEQVAITTGIVSSAVALGVRDLFHEAQSILIVSNAGANDVTRAAGSPYIFRTAFTNWQPNFALGEWAAENLGVDNVYVIAPDYAAGHEHIAGFRESFEAGGGSIAGEAFPPFGTTQDYQPFISEIGGSGATGTFAFFAGGEAINFVQQYQGFGLKDELPLIGPGFLTDDGVLGAQGEAALGLRTALHYSPLLDNETNQAHVAAFTEALGEPPTTYSVQSYDAAALLDLALAELGGDTSDPDAVVEAIEGVGPFDSPRGQIEIDAETHNVIQNQYLREVQEVEGGLGNVVIEDLGSYPDPGE